MEPQIPAGDITDERIASFGGNDDAGFVPAAVIGLLFARILGNSHQPIPRNDDIDPVLHDHDAHDDGPLQ